MNMIITGFQLSAAKASLNLDYNTLSNDTNVSKITLSRLVNTIKNLDKLGQYAWPVTIPQGTVY